MLKTYNISKSTPKCESTSLQSSSGHNRTETNVQKLEISNTETTAQKLEISNTHQKVAPKIEVPEKYKDLLKKNLVVNLIRYNNIEEALTPNQSEHKPIT